MTLARTSILAGALALGLGSTAGAATMEAPAFGFQPPVTTTFTFSWDGTPYANVFTFDPFDGMFDFDLTFVDYDGGPGDQTGYYVDTGGVRLTTDSTACDSAGGSFVGGCNLVNASSTPGEVLLSGLAGGTYTFGVYDSASPETGSVTFGLIKGDPISAVPLPATGLLLIGALAAAGMAGRRRRAS